MKNSMYLEYIRERVKRGGDVSISDPAGFVNMLNEHGINVSESTDMFDTKAKIRFRFKIRRLGCAVVEKRNGNYVVPV